LDAFAPPRAADLAGFEFVEAFFPPLDFVPPRLAAADPREALFFRAPPRSAVLATQLPFRPFIEALT
jgi:hypothetical protein